MAASPRRRRKILTLGHLKARMSSGIEYATKLLEDEGADHDLRLRGFQALIQAMPAYTKLIELHDLDARMQQLEHLSQGNGHLP
jgi:hypothetical protein